MFISLQKEEEIVAEEPEKGVVSVGVGVCVSSDDYNAAPV